MDAVRGATSSALASRAWVLIGLIVFFLAINLQYVFKVVHSDRENRSAFLRWAGQIRELDDGIDIWERYHYPNPPIMALILYPLVHLPATMGGLTWFYLKTAMAVFSLWGILRMLDPPERPFPWWGQVLTVGLSLRPIQSDLLHGNVNLLILFLVVASMWAFVRRLDFWAGILLALAIACKVTPVLFLPYFVWKRAWKTLAGAAIGLIVFLFIAPSAFLGWQANLAGLSHWTEAMVLPYAIEGKVVPDHQNQSLPGLLHRLLIRNPSFADYDEEQEAYVPLEYHNVADLDPAVVRFMVKGCLVLFALAVVWRCQTPTSARTHWAMVAEFGVIVLGMLIFSERTWKHHGVTMAIPFAVLCARITAADSRGRMRSYLVGTLVVVVMLMTLTSTGLTSDHSRLGKLGQVYGAYLWASILMLVGLFVVLGDSPRGRENSLLSE